MLQPNSSIKVFRYDINALRALAILGVLLFHYKIPYFTGGFAGVDVFFVISGYLMSKIIINGINKNTFSVLEFYGKRIKRIVPALLFLIIILTIACFFFYFPVDYKLSELNAAASLVFLSNVLYWKTTNYFATASDENILLHTWSLSVEWQFYLIYPFILIIINKIIKNKLTCFILFITGTILIFLASVLFTKADATASFYLFPSRSWEMFFGGVAFLGEDFVKGFKYRRLFAIMSYFVIIFCLMFFKSSMEWPGKYTIIPVFATFVVILCNVNDFKLLKHESVQFIGRVSYSLYLWHWPVYVGAQYMGVQMNSLNVAMLILLSLGLSYISYRFVESIEFKNNKFIISGAFSFMVITYCLSYFNTNNIVFKPKTVYLSSYKDTHVNEAQKQYSADCCFIGSTANGSFDKKRCLSIDEQKRNVLLIGDSHAAQFSGSLKESLLKKNIHLLQATASGCMPFIKPNGLTRCAEIMKYIYHDFVVNNEHKINGVIICANWVTAINGKDSTALINDLNSTIAYFEKYRIKVIVIGQNETYTMTYPQIAARENEYNIKISYLYINKNADKINDFLKENFKSYYVDIYNHGIIPAASLTNDPYMSDRNHFSKYGADLTVNRLLSDPVAAAFIGSVINSHTAMME